MKETIAIGLDFAAKDEDHRDLELEHVPHCVAVFVSCECVSKPLHAGGTWVGNDRVECVLLESV